MSRGKGLFSGIARMFGRTKEASAAVASAGTASAAAASASSGSAASKPLSPKPMTDTRPASNAAFGGPAAIKAALTPAKPVNIDLHSEANDDDFDPFEAETSTRSINVYKDDDTQPASEDVKPFPEPEHDPIAFSDPAPINKRESEPPAPAPKNRQELINELRKNYNEVLGLVRKVDEHLDTQSTRSERMLNIAEDSLRKLDHLPEMVEQNQRVADSIQELVKAVKDGADRNDAMTERVAKTTLQHLEAAQRQTAAIQQMQTAVARSAEAEQATADSMVDFKHTLEAIRESDAAREAELADVVAKSQKSLLIGVVAVGLLAVAALTAVLVGALG